MIVAYYVAYKHLLMLKEDQHRVNQLTPIQKIARYKSINWMFASFCFMYANGEEGYSIGLAIHKYKSLNKRAV